MIPLYQEPLWKSRPYQVIRTGACTFIPHWHSELEVIYVTRGLLYVTVAGVRYTLTKDRFIVIDSGAIHSTEASDEDGEMLLIEAGYELFGSHFSVFTESELDKHLWDKSTPEDAESPFFDYLDRITEIIFSEKAKDEIRSDLRLRAILHLFACELLNYSHVISPTDRHRRHGNDLLAMQKVLLTVEDHYAEKLSIDHMSDLTGYEKTRFCQLFKKAVGLSFHQYLNRRRIDIAKEMLRSSEYSMTDIGHRVGFDEAKNFSRVFRENCGCTPTEYRNRTV